MSSIIAFWAGLVLGVGGPVTGVSILPDSDRTQIVIAVDGSVDYRDFTMEAPSRLVVDLFGTRHALPRDNYPGIHKGGVASLRSSQYASDVVRIVLELDETTPYEIREEEGGLRILLDADRGSFEPWSTGAELEVASRSLPAAEPRSGAATGPIDAAISELPVAVGEGDDRSAALSVEPSQEAPVSVEFRDTPIQDVIQFFAMHSGRSIVAGQGVEGLITATIEDQPWREALEAILEVNGFKAQELASGIVRVDDVQSLSESEALEPLVTQAYPIDYATATELETQLDGVLSDRGSIRAGANTNTIIVNDVPRVHDEIAGIISEVDVRTPQVTIQAKIIFVNRTDLEEFGVTYDLKDSAGNQLNVVTPGAVDEDGDGVIELPDEQVQIGENVVSLGGNSVAALGNANNRVAGPTLTLLSSLIVGRHTLLTFVEALQSVNLSDIQAQPHLTVSENQTARIQVGERTPLRVIDQSATGAGGAGGGAGGGGAQGAQLPQATVQIEETGIILEATPLITSTNDILLDLRAERSAPQLAESDAGFIFTTQEAETRVLVADGQTVVIAGLTVTEENEVQSGIPMLMDLPLLGPLFRVTRQSFVQRDLIILVTPHIVRDEL